GALGSAPLIGAELPVDDVVYTQETGQQYSPFIAAGGPGALIVWRNDPSGGTSAISPLSIDFVRIDPQGNLLDPLPVAIGTPSTIADPEGPSVGWNGDQALVLWEVSILTSAGGLEMHGTRMTKDGVVLDPGSPTLPGGIVVEVGPDNYTLNGISILPFGAGYFVFWTDHQGSPWRNRVGADGSVPNT